MLYRSSFSVWQVSGALYPETVTPVTPQICTIEFNLAGGIRVGGGALTQALPQGGAAIEPYVYRRGHFFLGWDTSFYNVQQSMVVTARWTPENDTGMITRLLAALV